jgi:hypothetical protein
VLKGEATVKRIEMRAVWGILLILAGALFLLQEFNFITNAFGVLFAVLMAIAGAVFLYAYTTNRTQWWTLIPGVSLLGLAVLIILNDLFPAYGGEWGGAIFLGGIGLCFLFIYLTNRELWWTIIPAGVMLTLGAIVILDSYMGDTEGILFIGLGLTFALLGLVRTPQGRMTWAFIPALVLVIFGLLVTSALSNLVAYVIPALLILVGGYIILRNLRR